MTAGTEASRAQSLASQPDGSVWVSANAGSGKTTVLAHRVARLLLRGADPARILCLTYTKAAASVMQIRLFDQLGKWSMQDDLTLAASLASLGEEDQASQQLAKARTLFAAALETPGGLRIQTIHSFCDSVLRRFPLEAGLSPHFQLIDDNTRRDLIDTITTAIAEERADLFNGVATQLRADLDGDGMSGLTHAILTGRNLLDRFDPQTLRSHLGLKAGETREGNLGQLLAGNAREMFGQMRSALLAGNGEATEVTDLLERLLSTTPASIEAGWLARIFLYASGDKANTARPDRWAGVGVRKAHPELSAQVAEFCAQVEETLKRIRALALFDRTATLAAFAAEFLRRYDFGKQDKGLVDFDDQIGRVRQMLAVSEVAQWVQYRLDGGISHILIDEAQDTSPQQWDVVKSLTSEFFAGAGLLGPQRTLFVVGDEKQSIYSFQGAEPGAFGDTHEYLSQMLLNAEQTLADCELIYSYRSASLILQLVDNVLAGDAGCWLGHAVQHATHLPDKPGRIEIWDRIEPSEANAIPSKFLPVDAPPTDRPQFILARQIADWLATRLSDGSQVMRKGVEAPLEPGDILVLFQQRGPLFQAVLREIKARGLPVAGADRFVLTDELSVKDLLATLAFVATESDDLSLACALRSPLCGLTEADLYALAQGRGRTTLWHRLLARQAEFAPVVAMFQSLRASEGFLRPFELLEMILTRFGGRQKLIARLGAEQQEAIDELLNQAIAYESADVPTLTGFLEWIDREKTELKRQGDLQGNVIRLMTVHGAKGLEAPLVILPDTAVRQQKSAKAGLVALAENLPGWAPVASEAGEAVVQAVALGSDLQQQERHRLLYVALTRAESWLVICGAANKSKAKSWYDLVSDASETMDFRREGSARIIDARWPAAASPQKPDLAAPASALAAWTRDPAPVSVRPEPPISPSQLGGAHSLPGEEATGPELMAKLRGQQLHLLLDALQGRPATEWPLIMPDIAGEVRDEALALLTAPQLDWIFAPGSLGEVGIRARIGDRDLVGRIDRLIVGSERVTAVDYKSNRIVPDSPEQVPEGILRQMGAYATCLTQIWPGRRIETAILWTRSGILMPLPQNIVMASFSRRDSP